MRLPATLRAPKVGVISVTKRCFVAKEYKEGCEEDNVMNTASNTSRYVPNVMILFDHRLLLLFAEEAVADLANKMI